jgi:hypothetical protein
MQQAVKVRMNFLMLFVLNIYCRAAAGYSLKMD